MKIVCINGNIASGKSTLLKRLQSRGHDVVLEGLNRGKWRDVLSMYYTSPERYGYLFQTLVLAEMKETYAAIRKRVREPANPEGIVFVERSHLDCLSFAMLVHRNGHMSKEEMATFKQLYDLLLEQPDVVITLELSPKVCFERCKARGRQCETDISLSYLIGVDLFTKQIMEENSKLPNSPVHIKLDVFGKSTDTIASAVLVCLK